MPNTNYKASDVLLAEDYLIVIPGRTNADIVRTEKKYDRHSIGTVVIGSDKCLEHSEYEYDNKNPNAIVDVKRTYTDAKPGDVVVYDDSDAVETELEIDGKKQRVEFIYNASVVGIIKKKGDE